MRSDAAPRLDVSISPTGVEAWSGTHAWTPTSLVDAPVTINVVPDQTANMQVWNPLYNFDSVVTSEGNIGAGDETPTANVSMRARGLDLSASIVDMSPYAWWDCSDINGNNDGNLGYSDGSTVAAQQDKSGNGHHLTGSGWTLRTTNSVVTLPNGRPILDAGTSSGAWGAWATPGVGASETGSFGDPAAGWTMFAVMYNSSFASVGSYLCCSNRGASNDICSVIGMPNTHTANSPAFSIFDAYKHPAGDGAGAAYSVLFDSGSTAAWNANWRSLAWRYNGSHEAWIQNVALTGKVESGTSAWKDRADFRFLFGETALLGAITQSFPKYAEVIMFRRPVTEDERGVIEEYFAAKYNADYIPSGAGVSGPLTHWKNFDGDVDSVVNPSIKFGLGTTTNTVEAKLHVIDTLEPLRLGYDADSYSSFTVPSSSTANAYTLPATNALSTIGVLHNSIPAGGASTWSWSQVSLTADVSGRLPFANLAQGSARSVLGVTGNATADVASIQGAASQFLNVNSAGTSLVFATMTGDATLSGPAITIANDAVTFPKMRNAGANSVLVGAGSAGTGIDYTEITLGTGLSMTGTVLSSSGGGGGVTGSGTATHLAVWTSGSALGDSVIVEISNGVVIHAPDSASVVGGEIVVASGSAPGSSAGLVKLFAGDAISGSGHSGGSVTVTGGSGDPTGSGDGGSFQWTAGQGGDVGSGGYVTLTSGDGGSTSGDGGAFDMRSGNAVGTGSGGSYTMSAGNGGATSGDGGGFSMFSGSGPTNGNGGVFQIQAGSGSSNGGDIQLYTGDGVGGNGGNLDISLGAGGVTNGDIRIVVHLGFDTWYAIPDFKSITADRRYTFPDADLDFQSAYTGSETILTALPSTFKTFTWQNGVLVSVV